MSEETQRYASALWALIDYVLNSILFLLIGLEVLIINPSPRNFALGVVAIPIALVARWSAVSLPLLIPFGRNLNPRYVPFLTWAAVRGGISVALALSLRNVGAKPAILAATYAVVLFTIIVQGLTLPLVAKRLDLEAGGDKSTPGE